MKLKEGRRQLECAPPPSVCCEVGTRDIVPEVARVAPHIPHPVRECGLLRDKLLESHEDVPSLICETRAVKYSNAPPVDRARTFQCH